MRYSRLWNHEKLSVNSQDNPLSLDTRVALVTGAAGGVGRAVAVTLARYGAKIVATDHPAAAGRLEQTRHMVVESGGSVSTVYADLSVTADLDKLVERAIDEFDTVGILVNVAAIHRYPAPLLNMSEADWDRVQTVNFRSCLRLCQRLAPLMVKQGAGNIVTIASDSAFDVIADEGAYGSPR